jgi:TolB protein
MSLVWAILFFLVSFESCFGQMHTLYVKTESVLKKVHLAMTSDAHLRPELNAHIKERLEFYFQHAGVCQIADQPQEATFQLNISWDQSSIHASYERWGKKTEIRQPITMAGNDHLNGLAEFADAVIESLFNTQGIFSDQILFVHKDPNRFSSELFTLRFDGAPPVQITSDGHFKLTPLFIPGCSDQILYVSYAYGIPKLFSYDLVQRKQTPLIPLRGSQMLPAISYRGDCLSFISDAAGTIDLFVQKISSSLQCQGKPIQLLSNKEAVHASSAFHPYQSKLAFVSDREKKPKVYSLELMQALRRERSASTPLVTPPEWEATNPAFSPDGTKLAYCALIDHVRQIAILDLETNSHQILTEGPHHKENPSWAANSLHLAYNTTGDENELYMINLIQRKPVKITSGPGIKHYPCWERTKKGKIRNSNG